MSDTIIPVWTLGDRLAKAREEAGISVNEMARLLGVARTTISNWEHGRTEPSRPVIIAYHHHTNVPLIWFDGESPGSVFDTATYRTPCQDAA